MTVPINIVILDVGVTLTLPKHLHDARELESRRPIVHIHTPPTINALSSNIANRQAVVSMKRDNVSFRSAVSTTTGVDLPRPPPPPKLSGKSITLRHAKRNRVEERTRR